MHEETFRRGLGLSFGQPSVDLTGPEGIEAISTDRVIQRGDILMLDWGVGFLNFSTDMKRIAYVAKEGETEVPAELKNAYEHAAEARTVIKNSIRPGITAAQAEGEIYTALEAAGFVRIGFNQPTDDPKTTDVVIGCHSWNGAKLRIPLEDDAVVTARGVEWLYPV